MSTRLASRNFRNYWNNSNPEEFAIFREKLENTWNGITIQRPERDFSDAKPSLHMFFDEKRLLREVAWAGFGFQAWMQIYTHMLRRRENENNILVLDEPDIYLHPDLQRKLLRDARQIFSQFFIASHSIEIINEARASEIVSINDRYSAGKRIASEDDYASLFSYLGSNSNYELAALAKAKRVLFVEGKDGRLLRRFGAQFGFSALKLMNEIPVIQLGGFSQWRKALHAIWGFKKIARLELEPLAIFDRDYRTDEEVEDFVVKCAIGNLNVRILERKEIENYFLSANAIQKAVSKRKFINLEEVRAFLLEATALYEHKVRAQLEFCKVSYICERDRGIHPSTVSEKFGKKFSVDWKNLEYRIRVVPGKEVFSSLNDLLIQNNYGSLTPPSVISCMSSSDVGDGFLGLLNELNVFAQDP